MCSCELFKGRGREGGARLAIGLGALLSTTYVFFREEGVRRDDLLEREKSIDDFEPLAGGDRISAC